MRLTTKGNGYDRTLEVEDAAEGYIAITVSSLIVLPSGREEAGEETMMLDREQVISLIARLAATL